MEFIKLTQKLIWSKNVGIFIQNTFIKLNLRVHSTKNDLMREAAVFSHRMERRVE